MSPVCQLYSAPPTTLRHHLASFPGRSRLQFLEAGTRLAGLFSLVPAPTLRNANIKAVVPGTRLQAFVWSRSQTELLQRYLVGEWGITLIGA